MSVNSICDTSVHPFFSTEGEIRRFLPDAYKTRGFPSTERAWYQAPRGEYLPESYGEGFPYTGGFPASDPETVARAIFQPNGATSAILNPRTRGNVPDWRLGTALVAATNTWLSDKWLDHHPEGGGTFLGTIGVNPNDVEGSVKEIERWSADPRMVQIGVPLQSRELYGKPQFEPIWKAAAEAGLPVAVHMAGGAGIDNAPTPAGHARTYPHYAAYMPLNYFHHLASLIMDGVFTRNPRLKFVFTDGGIDLLQPLMWRLDTFWRAMREQTPWIDVAPSSYLSNHVRFCTTSFERKLEPKFAADWLALGGRDHLLMFASHYPYWSASTPAEVPASLLSDQRQRILYNTALDTYRLEERLIAT